MIWYKIFRYICFLLLLIFIGLFFISGVNVPYVSALHTSIQEYYHNIPRSFSSFDESNREDHNRYLSQQILKEANFVIDDFLNDISTETSLNRVILRQFDDLVYLMLEYLLQNEYFFDLIIYKDDELIYKYNNQQSTDIITIQRELSLMYGDLKLLFLFKSDVIKHQLDTIGELVYFSLNNQIYYSTRYADIGISTIDQLNSYEGDLTDIITLNNRDKFYVYSYENQIIEPALLFIPMPTVWNFSHLIQFLFIFSIVGIILLLIILDYVLGKRIESWLSQRHIDKTIDETNIKLDDLDWLDEFVQLENEMSKDYDNQNTK